MNPTHFLLQTLCSLDTHCHATQRRVDALLALVHFVLHQRDVVSLVLPKGADGTYQLLVIRAIEY
jgi:hypothetical protein